MTKNQTIFYVVDGVGKKKWYPCGVMRSNKNGGYSISFSIKPIPSNSTLVSLPDKQKIGLIRRMVRRLWDFGSVLLIKQ